MASNVSAFISIVQPHLTTSSLPTGTRQRDHDHREMLGNTSIGAFGARNSRPYRLSQSFCWSSIPAYDRNQISCVDMGTSANMSWPNMSITVTTLSRKLRTQKTLKEPKRLGTNTKGTIDINHCTCSHQKLSCGRPWQKETTSR